MNDLKWIMGDPTKSESRANRRLSAHTTWLPSEDGHGPWTIGVAGFCRLWSPLSDRNDNGSLQGGDRTSSSGSRAGDIFGPSAIPGLNLWLWSTLHEHKGHDAQQAGEAEGPGNRTGISGPCGQARGDDLGGSTEDGERQRIGG